jgi:hypothetical protein
MSGGYKRSRTRRAVNLGTFCSGLGLILTATILNVAYDRMDSPAPHISELYETFGKFGVTLTLVCAGLSVILLGVAMGGTGRSKSKGRGSYRCLTAWR